MHHSPQLEINVSEVKSLNQAASAVGASEGLFLNFICA
jgi:hypothetical protein